MKAIDIYSGDDDQGHATWDRVITGAAPRTVTIDVTYIPTTDRLFLTPAARASVRGSSAALTAVNHGPWSDASRRCAYLMAERIGPVVSLERATAADGDVVTYTATVR